MSSGLAAIFVLVCYLLAFRNCARYTCSTKKRALAQLPCSTPIFVFIEFLFDILHLTIVRHVITRLY